MKNSVHFLVTNGPKCKPAPIAGEGGDETNGQRSGFLTNPGSPSSY